MPLSHSISRSGTTLTVALTGEFTFGENGAFRRIVDEVVGAGAATVVVDLNGLRSVDSAGLSMLVLLRDRLAKANATISLRRPPPQIARVFEVVDFGKLFTIVQ